MINRKIQTILILSTLVISTFFAIPFFPFFPSAHATGSSCAAPRANCLFVDPATMAAAATGATVTFAVKVAAIDSFNAFDVSVVTDASTLSGLNITAASAGTGVPGLVRPNTKTSVFVNCVEGLGSGCGINDGPGIVHYAVAYNSSSTAGGSGTLFTVNYQAANGGPFAVPPFGAVVSPINSVIASAGNPVAISTASAVYGTPNPDFAASASTPVDQNNATLVPGSEGKSALTITSFGGFFDTVTISLGPISAASDFVSPTSVFVPAGGAASATIPVTVPLSTAPGTYHQTITVTGTTTGISHKTDLAIVVGSPQGAGLTCGSDISVVQGTTGANPVGIASQNGLFGGVFLSTSTASGSGLTATTDPASVTIPAGGSSAAVLYVAAAASAPLGTSMVTLSASFGGAAPSTCSINVTVLAAGSADFTLSSSDVSLIAIRGVKYTSTITVGNVAGFTGTVSTSVVVLPLVDKGPSVSVSAVTGTTATLTFNTPPARVLATQLLTYKVVVIGRSGSQSHSVQVVYTLEDFGIQARGHGNFPEFVLTATECNVGKLSFGSLNGFSGILTVSRFRMVDIGLTGTGVGFPTGVSWSFNNTSFSNSDVSRINPADGRNGLFTADATANHILGVKINVTSGSFVAGPLTICTTADLPFGVSEFQLQIRAKIVINGVKVENRKNVFVQINNFDLFSGLVAPGTCIDPVTGPFPCQIFTPSPSFLVVRQGTPSNTVTTPITMVGGWAEDLCCSAGFGTFPFLDFVSLTASVSPDPALTNTKLTVSIAPGPYLTTDLINPTANLIITVGAGGQGGLFTITVTGVAQHTPALHRSLTILLSVPSTIVQMPSLTVSTSPGLATFTATVTNTDVNTQFVQVVCSVASRTPGGSIYSPQSTVVALAAGATTTITFTQTTTAQDSGQLFNFLCGVNFGTSADSLLFVSKDKGKGTFTAS